MQPSGAGVAAGCGMQAHPAGTPLDSLGVAAECTIIEPDGEADGGPEPLLLIYAPDRVSRLEVVDPENRVIATFDGVSRGLASVSPTPGGGVLRLFTAGSEPTELAVISSRSAEIVDRAGHGAGG
jgi:hypothetical protein